MSRHAAGTAPSVTAGDAAREALTDSFGRRIDYLRVSVTDRCNYRCFYCMPETGCELGSHREFLTYDEITRLVRLFSEMGVSRVRLTGGEPLIRRNVAALVEMLAKLPEIRDLSLSTNGHLLDRFAPALKRAGLKRVNISLDAVDPRNFARITRGGDLAAVLRGIDTAVEVGLSPVKLNMVVMRGINDQEIEPMLDFALGRGIELRFIETMPVGSAGIAGMAHFYPADLILKRIRARHGSRLVPVKESRGAGPARMYRVDGGSGMIGVISAVSRHFCEGCNRVRLTTRGELVLCLGRENRVALRKPLREGWTDDALKEAIRSAIRRKPERHDFVIGPGLDGIRGMSELGG